MSPIGHKQKLANEELPTPSKPTKDYIKKQSCTTKICNYCYGNCYTCSCNRNVRRKYASIFNKWPITITRKGLRIFRQLFLKLNILIAPLRLIENLAMKKAFFKLDSSSTFILNKMLLVNMVLWKRVVIAIIVSILSFIFISWNQEPSTLYNKWKAARYVKTNNNERNKDIIEDKTNDCLTTFWLVLSPINM